MKKIILPITILMLASLILIGAGCWEKLKPGPSFSTYSNTEYGFSLEYPVGWHKLDNPEFNSVFFSSKEEEPPMGGVSFGARVEIFVIENSENLGLEEWIGWNKAQGGPEENIMEKEEITVGGKKAIKEIVVPRQRMFKEGPPIIVCLAIVYLAKDNYIIQINYFGREPDYSDNLENFQHLLDSFKF